MCNKFNKTLSLYIKFIIFLYNSGITRVKILLIEQYIIKFGKVNKFKIYLEL